MEKATVGIRELKDKASAIIERVEEGEAITVTKHGRAVARIVSTAMPPHLSALIADGTVRSPRALDTCQRNQPSSEALARVPQSTSPRVGAEPLPRYQRLDQALGRRAGSRGGPDRHSKAGGIRTTSIAHVEATAALTRMLRGKRLTSAQLNRALDDLESIWRGIFSHAVNDELLTKATESARAHSLRAYDSVHLAGALSFAGGEELEVACWDKELRKAAKKHGFALVPQRL